MSRLKKLVLLASAAALTFALLGCGGGSGEGSAPESSASSGGDDRAQIQQAIEKHLSSRGDLDMNAMEIVIDDLQVTGDEAVAQTTFRATANSQAMMEMAYKLTRDGSGWKVEGPASGGGHGDMQPPAGGSGLPPGHPPAEGGAQSLPPGHP